jgi:hypothetical protein
LNSLLVHRLYSLLLECCFRVLGGYLILFITSGFVEFVFLGVFLLQTLLEIKEPLVLGLEIFSVG